MKELPYLFFEEEHSMFNFKKQGKMKEVTMEIPSGSFALLNKANSKGEKCIYLRYFTKGKYVKRSTDIWIQPDDWDVSSQVVTAGNPNAARINNRLINLKAAIDGKLLLHKGPITSDVLKDYMAEFRPDDKKDPEKPALPNIVNYALEVNDLLYNKSHYGYSSWYNKKKVIEAFEFYILNIERTSVPLLNEVTVGLFDRYIAYRKNILKNKSAEAINKTLVPLYAALRYAVDNGLVEQKDVSAVVQNFLPLKQRRYTDETDEEKVRYLTPDQMRRLYDYSKTIMRERTREIMDIFFFAYYACGMRISDIITLEWKHVDFEKKQIIKKQVKTKQEAGVPTPLSPKAIEILQRWLSYNRNPRFVFNLLDPGFDVSDDRALMMARNTKDKTFNKSLLTVSRNAKMPFTITMHTARHSFAVQAIHDGMSLHLLSKLMGHATIITTEKIYARFLEENVQNQIQSVMEMDLSKFPRQPEAPVQKENAYMPSTIRRNRNGFLPRT